MHRKRGRDEGQEKAGEPGLAEMSQERVIDRGSSGLITGKMSVKG